MTTQIWLDRTGGPEVLQARTIDRQTPGPGQVWLEQEAIGVNYLDVTQRKGAVPIPLPGGIGLEGAGRIAALGAGVTDFAIGDRVAYALGPIGSYASGRLFPAERLLRLPDDLSMQAAASILFKGLTAQYLTTSTYPVTNGTVILLYGVAVRSVEFLRAGQRIWALSSSASYRVRRASTRPRRSVVLLCWCGAGTICRKASLPRPAGVRQMLSTTGSDARHSPPRSIVSGRAD